MIHRISRVQRLFRAAGLLLLASLAVACSDSANDATSAAATTAETPTAAAATGMAESEAQLIERARDIHSRVMTLDTHVDISPANFTTTPPNYTGDLPTQVNLPKMAAGGLDAAFFIVYVGQGPLTDAGYADAHGQAMAKFDAIHRLTAELAPERIGLATTAAEARAIAASGRKVALIGVENAYPIGLDLDNIRVFAERGARYMSLAHNGHSQFSDSNTGEIREGGMRYDGLSPLGRDAVAELNRWGVMIDLSHPSKDATMEMFELSRAPMIASHSAARALNDVPRNMDDEQLAALKANGGVIQTVAFRSYLDSDKHAAFQLEYDRKLRALGEAAGIEVLLDRRQVFMMPPAERSAYLERIRPLREQLDATLDDFAAPPVDVADFVDHIDYLVEKVGIDHVGISSDFDGGGGVTGWNDASETFNVTLELVRRGYSEADIERIWSGNLLRVMEAVRQVGEAIRAESG